MADDKEAVRTFTLYMVSLPADSTVPRFGLVKVLHLRRGKHQYDLAFLNL